MATPNVNSTPFRASYAGRREYQQIIENAQEAQKQYGKQMRSNWAGPCDPLEFMQKRMPCAQSQMVDMPKDVKFELPVRTEPKLEKHIYQLFDKTIKDHDLSPNFMFFIGADGRAKGGDVDGQRTLYRPDGGVREMQPAPRDHGHNTRGIKQNLVIENPDPEDDEWTEVNSKAFNWHEDSLVVEFKKSHKMDPFFTAEELKGKADGTVIKDGPEGPLLTFAKNDEELERIRGPLTAYATEVFDHQHRTHIFQLLVCGRRARFIFWDHSGALVSDAFDYTDKSELLVEFFWRYNRMTPEARGVDVTAQLASVEEQALFNDQVGQLIKAMNDPLDKQRKIPNAEQTLDPSFPVYRVTVLDISGKSEDVLIRAPFVRSHSALGRATRGYIAYVPSSEKLKFLKDTWRVEHPRLTAERLLYSKLEKANVPNVPKGAFGGDVSANGERSRTRCREWAGEQELKVAIDSIRRFHHHRLLQELAYPVGTAPNAYEFVYAFRDCIDAIEAAYKKHKILHRDLSIGNVMIKGEDSTGILADWDHAAKEVTDGSPYQNFRTGTWQFISVKLLKNPKQPHIIVDDFESLFWSLLYGALLYFPHGKSFPMAIFGENDDIDEGDRLVTVGGRGKSDALGDMPKLVNFQCQPLNELIAEIADEFSYYYTCKRNLDGISDKSEDAPTKTAPLQQGPVEFARAPPVLPQTSALPVKKDPAAAREEFQKCERRLRDPATWKNIYDKFLADQQPWKTAGSFTVPQDRYKPRTTKQKSQKDTKSHLTSCQTGSQLAEFDAIMASFVKKNRQQEEDKAVADDLANQMSDADDELESCVDKRDHKERIDAMETEFPPVSRRSPSVAPLHPPLSDPPSPATEYNPDIPAPLSRVQPTSLPSFPPPSLSLLSGHSVGSSRLKRSIDEIAPGPSSQSIDPVPKKSRSRARVKAEPSDRQTRSSSRKTVTRPLAGTATVAVDTKTEKESRLRRPPRRVQSSDLSVARPRREGLRPRTTRSTIQ